MGVERGTEIKPSVFNTSLGTLRMLMNGKSCLIPLLLYNSLMLKTSPLKGYITLAFCILVVDTRKQFQLQTGVFLKRPDVVTFDETIRSLSFLSN